MKLKQLNWLAPLLKEAASWAVFLWGIAIGFLCTTFFGGFSTGLNNKADWPRFLGLVLLGLIPLLGSILALRDRRQAAHVFLLAAFLVAAILIATEVRSHKYDENSVPVIGGITGLVLLPGLFWRITNRWRWRPLIAGRGPGESRCRQPVILNATLLLTVVLAAAFVSLYFPAYSDLNCYKGSPPVSVQTSPQQVVFTGRVLSVAHPMPAWSSPWALMRVERVYWGLPRWMSWIVFVHGYFKLEDKGQEYFVDAYRSKRPLTRFLPVVEFYACCHTTLLSNAEVDVRVLQDGAPRSGVRILGRVYRIRPDARGWSFIPGATVVATSLLGSVSALTDKDGIYDLKDVPAGVYSLRIGSTEYSRAELKKVGDVCQRDLDLLHPHVQ